MDKQELYSILSETGLPVAYRAFREDECVSLPLIVYEEGEPNVFAADGIPYYIVPRYEIELQEAERDSWAERAIADALLTHGIFFSKSDPEYNDGEKFYSITYTIEV